jgi:hypothetical protein
VSDAPPLAFLSLADSRATLAGVLARLSDTEAAKGIRLPLFRPALALRDGETRTLCYAEPEPGHGKSSKNIAARWSLEE